MEKSQQEGYQVQFVSHNTSANGDFVEYLVKVTAPGGHIFHIKDRYSRMRSF
jgi:hypothetical protein